MPVLKLSRRTVYKGEIGWNDLAGYWDKWLAREHHIEL